MVEPGVEAVRPADSCSSVLVESMAYTLDTGQLLAPVEQEISQLAWASPCKVSLELAHVLAPSCKGGARKQGPTAAAVEPMVAPGHGERGAAVATLELGTGPSSGGPKHATGEQNVASEPVMVVVAEEEGSQWLARSTRWTPASSQQHLHRRRKSAAVGSNSLPPPLSQSCVFCVTGTSEDGWLCCAG